MKRVQLIVAGGLLPLLAVAVLAAEPERRETARAEANGVSDAALAACLAIDNAAEIKISQFGQERAQNADVKQFAAQMVEEHTALSKKLQPLLTAGGDRRSERAAERAERKADRADDKAGADSPRTGRVESVSISTAGNPMLAIKQEVANECLATTQRELKAKPAGEFDKCFMGLQVHYHLHMLDTLKVFQKHASGDLQQVISEATTSTQAHLDHAKKLLATLEATPTGRAARVDPTETTN